MSDLNAVVKIITVDEIKSSIATEFPTGVRTSSKSKPRRVYVDVDKEVLFQFCKFIKEKLDFGQCSCVCGVDRKDKFQTVYHISSYTNNSTIEIVVDLPHDDPEVDSVTPLWGGANWHERETYDMFGIIFKGHPNLKRIMLPQDYKFYPFRKDFEFRGP